MVAILVSVPSSRRQRAADRRALSRPRSTRSSGSSPRSSRSSTSPRLASVRAAAAYARSFFGIVDLLAVLPTYIAIFVPELAGADRRARAAAAAHLPGLQAHRLLDEYQLLAQALAASRRKILVFLSAVLMVVLIVRHAAVRRRRPGARLHRHPDVGLLGDHDDHHGGLRRHHAEDRPRPPHRVGDDADRLGHAGRADGHRHRGDDGAPHEPDWCCGASARVAARSATTRDAATAACAAPCSTPDVVGVTPPG